MYSKSNEELEERNIDENEKLLKNLVVDDINYNNQVIKTYEINKTEISVTIVAAPP